MLSFGIRFGQGFDAGSMIKMMHSVPTTADFDVVIIGTNPGGVAFAKEASLAGKKTALIKCNNYSPAEAEGFDEDLNEMSEALGVSKGSSFKKTSTVSVFSSIPSSPVGQTKWKSTTTMSNGDPAIHHRKVRESRLDLNNEFFKRGKQCRKLMHNTVILGDLVENAFNSGWRLTTTRPPLTINWTKMSEEIMDFVMRENWMLASELGEAHIEIIEGQVALKDNRTCVIRLPDMTEKEFTSDLICIALPSQCIIPEDVDGAVDYGITSDDFIRLKESPGKTLVVGALQEGIECAGILASAHLPTTVVTRSTVLKDCDKEISNLIMKELRTKGVKFKEKTNLVSIEMARNKKLQATFEPVHTEEEEIGESEFTFSEEFDTVLFAVGRRVAMKNFDLSHLDIELDPETRKIKADKTSATKVPHIYVVGEVQADCPESMEISELAGKLLGRRVFHAASEIMDYSLIPSVIYTPTEYAFVGLSENAAAYRLGESCIEVCYGSLKPLKLIMPSQPGECFGKVIALKSNDLIIGLHILGPQAEEVIQGLATAIGAGLTLTNFRTIVGLTGTIAQELFKLNEFRSKDVFEETVAE